MLGLPGVPILPEFEGFSPSNFRSGTNFQLTRVVLRRKILCEEFSKHVHWRSITTEQVVCAVRRVIASGA